jgi:hypothetical protein
MYHLTIGPMIGCSNAAVVSTRWRIFSLIRLKQRVVEIIFGGGGGLLM